MKKLSAFICIIFLTTHIFAQEWTAVDSPKSTAPKVKLLSDTEQATEVSFSLGGFFKEEVNTPQGKQYIITAPKMASMLEEGAPDLPLYAVPVLIGDRDEMEVGVKAAKYQDFEGVEVAPSKGNLSRQVNPDDVPFRYGEAYAQNRFFPDTQAQLDQPYILRDFRGQNILVYPFAYNPVTKTLRVYTQLTLEMRKTGDNGSNAKLSRKSGQAKMSPEAEAMYRHRFVNYRERAAKYSFVEDEGAMLVICPEVYLNAMQPFVTWKNESGRPTTMVSLADAGGNNVEQIKSFIFSHYNNPDENLCYVLLVGDYADITPKALNGVCSDIYLGQLEGEDYYPEVFVGRFSAESVADVENQVAKMVYYERDITADADWLGKGIGIGSTEGSGQGHNGGEADYVHMDYIRDTLMHYTYNEVSQHYLGVGVGTNAAMLSANFNAGAGICNYCNHGSIIGWYVGGFTNSEVDALVNDYKWPFIWSTACLNGQFYGTCFAEAWMRATNNVTGAPTGAIGGMFSWMNQPWQPPMTGQDEMVDVLCEWRSADQFHHTFGGASLNGNMKILDMHPSDQGETHNTWILFGDPSLLLRTDTPTELNLAVQPEAIFIGQSQLRLTADADYALATLSIDGNVVCSTPIVDGEATLVFESPAQVGTAKLVVTGFNKVTVVREMDIIPATGAYLTYESFAVNDANGQADFGETVSLDVTIKNIGNQTASNVQVTLSTDSPYVTVVDGMATIPSIEATHGYTITNDFQIAVNESIVDGTQVYFTLTCTDGSHTWTSPFRLTLHAPAFALVDFRPAEAVNPGDNGQLLVGIKNIGSSDVNEARLQLYSSTIDLNFGQSIHALGAIPAGNTAIVTVDFTTSDQLPDNTSVEVQYLMDAYGYGLEGVEILNIGAVKETFETGDFSSFPWQTLGGSHWYLDNSTANTGTYSARSGVISHNNLTTLQVEMQVEADGEISFFKKICTEADKDKLTFYIDNVTMGVWSGEVDWSRESFPVTAGAHRFRWIYLKNGSGTYGEDCCWLDDVQFPSSTVITFLPALELQAQVNLSRVTLSWQGTPDAMNYLIRRDGEVIAMQSETSFSQYVGLGTYVYSVSAIDAAHQCSLPAFAEVEVTTVGLDATVEELRVYPNPASDLLYLDLGQPFDYAIFDAVGRQVAQGQSKEKAQIRCGDLPKGLYFLHVVTPSQVVIKKIVVE
jgi:hypothetical protein